MQIESALEDAVSRNDCEAAKILLSCAADVELYDGGTDTTLLMRAAEKHSSPEMLELLIEAGAAINKTGGYEGMSPLAFAVSSNAKYALGVVETLISCGADVNSADLCDRSVLNYACEKCIDSDTISLLIKNGADVSSVDYEGRTPLMTAAGSSGKEAAKIVNILLQHGASACTIDYGGRTALHHAAVNERLCGAAEVIDSLIFAGADVSIKDENGETALDLAKNDEVREILKELM